MSLNSIINIVKHYIVSSGVLKMPLPSEIKMLKHIVSSNLLENIVCDDKFDMSLLEPGHDHELLKLILSDQLTKNEFLRVVTRIIHEHTYDRLYSPDLICYSPSDNIE